MPRLQQLLKAFQEVTSPLFVTALLTSTLPTPRDAPDYGAWVGLGRGRSEDTHYRAKSGYAVIPWNSFFSGVF